MKRALLFVVVLFAFVLSSSAQQSGKSPVGSLHIGKQIRPPVFVVNGKPVFKDKDNNMAIDANEECQIVLSVTNNGYGPAQGLKAVMNITGDNNGLHYTASKQIPDIKVGETREITFPISTDINTVDGQVEVELKITEPHTGGIQPQYVVLETRAFEAPLVKCMDYALEGNGVLTLGVPFTMKMIVQNIRSGKATNVKIDIKLPDGIMNDEGTNSFHYSYNNLNPGEHKDLSLNIFPTRLYSKQEIPIKVDISEYYGRYAVDTTIVLQLEEVLLSHEVILARQKEIVQIDTFSLTSDIDKNIPETSIQNPNIYVMIIANQNYKHEQDVSTALNDARSMKQYCTKTLGVPENQIRYYENCSYVEMHTDISRFANTMKMHKDNPDAKFMVFYFGHGMADQNKNVEDSYLLPTDASTQLQLSSQSAISRNWMMEQFASAQPRQLVVFLESCFSGASNTDQLLSYAPYASATRFTDNTSPFRGNILVMTASSGSQTANAYPQQRHNIFTYEFLKLIQSSKGNVTLGKLFDQAKHNTAKTSDKIFNGKRYQTPGVISSEELKDQWRSWTLN